MALATTDTLLSWQTSANTTTATGVAASTQFGEGLSYTRLYASNPSVFSQFFVNTNFYGSSDGMDLEAIVVPVITYSINANFTASAPNATATPGSYCTNQSINFVNTTNPNSVVYNRQFNFNKFTTYWGPIASFSVPLTPADPIDNWTFSNNSAVTLTTTNASNTLTAPGSFNTTLEIKYRHSPLLPGDPLFTDSDTKTATYNVVQCTSTTTATGINEIGGFENLSIFPNPTVSGKTTISGLNGTNISIMIYDMLGQLVSNANCR